jgi:predicted transcriptional regulator
LNKALWANAQSNRRNLKAVKLGVFGIAFDDPIVWVLIIFFLLLVVLPLWLYFRHQSQKRNTTESVIISLVRSRNGVSLDDVIIGAHISSDEANRYMQQLISRNALKTENKDGKTMYVSA